MYLDGAISVYRKKMRFTRLDEHMLVEIVIPRLNTKRLKMFDPLSIAINETFFEMGKTTTIKGRCKLLIKIWDLLDEFDLSISKGKEVKTHV